LLCILSLQYTKGKDPRRYFLADVHLGSLSKDMVIISVYEAERNTEEERDTEKFPLS